MDAITSSEGRAEGWARVEGRVRPPALIDSALLDAAAAAASAEEDAVGWADAERRGLTSLLLDPANPWASACSAAPLTTGLPRAVREEALLDMVWTGLIGGRGRKGKQWRGEGKRRWESGNEVVVKACLCQRVREASGA